MSDNVGPTVIASSSMQRRIEVAPFEPRTLSMSGDFSKASSEMPVELKISLEPGTGEVHMINIKGALGKTWNAIQLQWSKYGLILILIARRF